MPRETSLQLLIEDLEKQVHAVQTMMETDFPECPNPKVPRVTLQLALTIGRLELMRYRGEFETIADRRKRTAALVFEILKWVLLTGIAAKVFGV